MQDHTALLHLWNDQCYAKYYRQQTANFIHQLGINSKHYDGLNALVYAYQTINIIMGNQTWEYYVERERQEYEEKKEKEWFVIYVVVQG